ncbi:LmbE family N-acetylglucosaminyl deacetylase [Deinococcus metalli]|uniref:LmbE family N-acetylglucosaminyl deacetylase n=1 Tax=Deinococcus metalli TaxID=1141878 RepID=A0A7W8KF31_9DEIO|nr:PIG-L deacetylase family protein [Deinococcus metalli]MBB5377012.1 LmbE family N-acetylglucosaminyl deacetylase [Deinococcus metalli]GHF47050.1 PIG-L domain-containing protein [Deinococcus metalli]
MTRVPRPRKEHLLPATLLLAGAALAVWINLPVTARMFGGSARRVQALPALGAFHAGQRVLVLSPHPDDETLCCAGMIQRARAQGAQVWITWVTAGDGFEFDAALTQGVLRPGATNMRALGATRAAEARRAAQVLGVPADHTFVLGYPDRGLARLATSYYARPYTAPRTAASAVYVAGALTPGAPYTGEALEADLNRVLDRVQPDLVFAPAPQDFHTDHRTVAALAMRLMAQRRQENRLRYWVVHGGVEWPVPKGLHGELPLTVPPRARALPWERADLSDAEVDRKLQAVNTYRTQTRIMGRFMRAFVRRNELLSPGTPDLDPVPESAVP